jgi:hypothetical protein
MPDLKDERIDILARSVHNLRDELALSIAREERLRTACRLALEWFEAVDPPVVRPVLALRAALNTRKDVQG